MTNETIQTIRSRRSCRAYKPEQITNEELEAVLGAGTYAASAMGKQSAKIVVVQDAATREKLSRMNAGSSSAFCGTVDRTSTRLPDRKNTLQATCSTRWCLMIR